MDPAAFTPPKELKEVIIDSASRLVNLWLENEGEGFLSSMEARLQQLISSHPWLLDSLHPLVQDFILHELHHQPPPLPLASTEDVLSEPPDVELPCLSEPSPRRKQRSRRRRITPQPDVGTCKQLVVLAAQEPSLQSTTQAPVTPTPQSSPLPVAQSSAPLPVAPSVAVWPVAQLAARPVAQLAARPVAQLATRPVAQPPTPPPFSPQPLLQSPLVQPSVSPPAQSPVQLPLAQSPVQLPLAQSPVQLLLAQSPVQLPLAQLSAHSLIQSPSSPSHPKQGTHFTTTFAGSQKLVFFETVIPSRASPEAGCQPPADSGPLEVKLPAPAASPENSTEQSQQSSPAKSSSEFTHPPPSSGEPTQHHGELAPGSGEPSQHHVELAGGSGEPSQHHASSAGGPGEPGQRHAVLAGGPGGPSQHILVSADGSGESVQPPPAASPSETSTSGSAAATLPSGSATLPSGPALSGPQRHLIQLGLYHLAFTGRFPVL
ncbi:collagen type VI alpha [Sarotherodon galilaeus]